VGGPVNAFDNAGCASKSASKIVGGSSASSSSSYNAPMQQPSIIVGGSKDHPYRLETDATGTSHKALEFGPENAPEFLQKKSWDGKERVYQRIEKESNDKELMYRPVDADGAGHYSKFTYATGKNKGSMGKPEYEATQVHSPLVFDLNGDGVNTTKPNRNFDIDADGKQDQISSVGKDDGTLVFDKDGDGQLGKDGSELFGNHTDLDGDGKADGFANGFEALKGFADKKLGQQATSDGKLDASEIAQLDKGGLKMNVDGKLQSLGQLGIDNIDLGYANSDKKDAHGNEFRQQGSFNRNGQQNSVVDVWYKTQA
jgi:hypothetical protein